MGSRPGAMETPIDSMGRGLPAPNAVSSAHKRLTALEAAKYRAVAQLAERVHGLRVERLAKIRDLSYAGDEVTIGSSRRMEGVTVIDSEYDEVGEVASVTVRVILDSEGNIIPERGQHEDPMSLSVWRSKAESEARAMSLLALRAKLESVELLPNVTVSGAARNSHDVRERVDKLIEEAEIASPSWQTDTKCTVRASLTVSPREMKQLQSIAEAL